MINVRYQLVRIGVAALLLLGAAPAALRADELTVKDGVVVKFGDAGELVVRDGLVCQGGVLFTSENDDSAGGALTSVPGSPLAGDWRGIRIERSALAPAMLLEGLNIRYAGADGFAGMTLGGTDVSLSGFTIENSAGPGLLTLDATTSALSEIALRGNGVGFLLDLGSSPSLSTSLVEDNAAGALSIDTSASHPAMGNWWGHPTGPLDDSDDTATGGLFNPEGLGDPVSDGIDYEPFSNVVPLFGLGFSLPEGELAGDREIAVELRAPTATSFRLSEDPTFAGVPFQPMTPSTTFMLSDGEGLKTVYAEFQAPTGNTASLSQQVQLDYSGPSVVVTDPPANAILQRPLTVQVEASDPAGVTQVEFLVDGNLVFTDTTNSYSFEWNILTVTPGAHQLGVRATDSLGRTTLVTVPVTISPAPPLPPQIVTPANNTLTADTSVEVLGIAEPMTTVSLYRPVNILLGSVATDAAGGFALTVPLIEGLNKLTATAADGTGVSVPSAEVDVIRDTGAPFPPVLIAAVGPDARVQLQWTQPSNENPAAYRVFRSTTAFTDISQATFIKNSLFTLTTDTPPSDGTYFYGVTALDALNNESGLSNVESIVIDVTPPTATVATNPTGPLGPGPVDVTLTVSEEVDGGVLLNVTPLGASTDNIDLTSSDGVVWTGQYVVGASTPSGTATFAFLAEDLAGNSGSAITSGGTVEIDTRGPHGTVTTVPAGTVGPGDVAVTLDLDEPASGTPLLSFLPPAGGSVAVALSGGPTSWTGTLVIDDSMGDGPGTFDLEATDDLGNTFSGAAGGAALVLDTTPVDLPTGLTATSRPDGEIELAWDVVADAAGYAVYRLPAADTFPSPSATQVVSGLSTPTHTDLPPADGAYRYAVTSFDALNNESGLSADAVAVSDRVPPADLGSLTAVIEGSGVRVTWTAPGAGAMDSYRLYRETAPFSAIDGLTPLIPALGGTTTLDTPPADGDYSYGVVAVDLAGNVSNLITAAPVTFDQGAPMITITGVEDALITNQPVTPVYSATDFSLQSLDATLNGAPFASGTTITDEGDYVLVVTAEDTTSHVAEETVSFTVDTTAPVISIVGVEDGMAYEAALTPQFSADDLHLDTVSATLNGEPFDSGTTVEQDDSYTLVVDALDLAGNTAQTTVSFTLDGPTPPLASLDILIDTGGLPTLSWDARPEPDVAGYRIVRNGLLATPVPVTGTQYTDPGFEPNIDNVYQVTVLDTGGHESAPIVATVRPVSLELASYGQEIDAAQLPVFDPSGGTTLPEPDTTLNNVLTRRYLDQITVNLANHGFDMVTPGDLTMRLSDGTSVLDERVVPSGGPLAPGGGRDIAQTFASGNAPGPARLLELELALPSEPGTQLRLKSSHSLLLRDNPLPVEIFSEPLIRGALADVNVKVFNHGSVPLELITSVDDGPTPEIEVRLRNTEGALLSSARLDDRSAAVIVTPDNAFASIASESSYLSADIPLQVPGSAPDDVVIEAVVLVTHSSVLGPDDVLGSTLQASKSIAIGDPPYLAQAQTDQDVYDQGDPVTITGSAFDLTRAPAADSLVKVGLSTRGFVRTLFAVTDASGNFEVTFQPFATEAGSYTVWATHPTVVEQLAQDDFNILGLLLNPSAANARFSRNGSLTFPVRLKNNGELPITGLTPDLVGGYGISGSVDLSDVPLPLNPGQRGTMRITLNATPDADLDNFATLTLTSPEGAVRVFDINAELLEAIPLISAAPSYVDVGVSIGHLVARNVRITNVGFAPLTGITIDEPTLPWISLGMEPTLPPINPGESADITLLFNPDESVDQGVYSDSIVVRSGNHIPFGINLFPTVTSAENGSVEFLVKNIQDEVVPNARVSIRSTKIPDLVITKKTDANGLVLFDDLPAGPFQYKVQATGHEVVVDNFTVEPNVVTPMTVYLNVVYVSLEWSVVPVVIEDRYDITLTASFETQVPAPVLVADPGFFKLVLEPGGTFAGTVTITNHGLIAADNVVVTSGSSPELTVETLIDSIPRIDAMGTAEIPFRVTLAEDAPTTTQGAATSPQTPPTSSSGSSEGPLQLADRPWTDPPPANPAGFGDCIPTYNCNIDATGSWFCPAGFGTSSSAGSGCSVTPPKDGCGGCDTRCAPCSCLGIIPGIGGAAKGICECIKQLSGGCIDEGAACTCLSAVSETAGALCDCIAQPNILGCIGNFAEDGSILSDALDAIDNITDAFNCGFELGLCLLDIDFEGGSSTSSFGGSPIPWGGYGGGGGSISTTWSGCE